MACTVGVTQFQRCAGVKVSVSVRAQVAFWAPSFEAESLPCSGKHAFKLVCGILYFPPSDRVN